MDDAQLIKLHAMLADDEQVIRYLEDSLAADDPRLFIKALVNVALVRGIKTPPHETLGGWASVHALLRELDCEGLFVRFVADTSLEQSKRSAHYG
jgi:hypothetical protein